MADPTVKVEAAFGYSPTDPAPVWVDITQYVKGLDSKRGRNTELDTIDAGTATLTLDNAEGLFTPRQTVEVKRKNLCLNPSFEVDTSWFISYANISGSTLTKTTGAVKYGSYGCAAFGPAGNTTDLGIVYTGGSFPTGTVLTIGFEIAVASSNPSDSVYMFYRDNSAGVTYGSATVATLIKDGLYHRYVAHHTVPAGYTLDRIYMVTRDIAATQGSQSAYFDGITIEEGVTDGSYFDGDSAPSGLTVYSWDGTPGLSESSATAWPIRPRTPLRITGTIQQQHAITYGFIERWPLDLSDSAPTMDVPVVDMSKVLSDIKLGNSDTGFIERTKPDIYFPMQESASPLLDATSGFKLLSFWDGYLARPNPTDDNPLPVITYGSDSILPSRSGSSVDLGGYWVEQQ